MDNKKQYIRKGQKVTFSAKLKKGDKSLTSWIVYEGNQCDDDHIIKEEKQVGTEFTFTFEKAGEYTIISYGKREEIKKKSKCINKTSISPKTNNEGKEEIVVDKLDSGCAIRLKVIENTIVSIDCVENKIRNAVRKGTTDNWELKKGASVTFKANFYIEKPTEEELSSLKMFVLDSNKNILVAQEGNNISFTPENNNEEYTIVAEHITPSGDKSTKKITGKCVLNSVISIKPVKSGELFRPNEEIIFKVDRMKFSADLEDTSRTKWYLNTILKQEGGETFKFSSDKKDEYFVEAANIKPNSSNNKKDPDTCVFKIVDNEVKSISIKGMPKVGRPFELNAKTTFPDLTLEEKQKIKWNIPFNYKDELGDLNINLLGRVLHLHDTQNIKEEPRTKKITPLEAGTFKVSCRINSEIIEENIEIVQPKISSAHWIDKDGSSGNILEKAGYYQEMYAYAKHIGLDEEEVILEVYDVTNKQKPIYTSEKVVVPKGSKEICIPYTIKKTYKGKTEEEKKKEDRERKDIQIFFKIKAADTNFLIVSSNKEFENNLLTITNKGDIIDAYFCNSDDSQRYRFVKLNTKIYLKLYVANMIGKEVEVFFYDQYGFSLSDLSQNFNWKSWDSIAPRVEGKKAFYSDKKVIDNKGELLVELNTSKFKKAQNHIHITAVFKTKVNDKEKGAYMNLANHLVLYYEKKLNDIVENVSAIKVAKGKVKRVQLEEEEGHSCPRCTAPVTVAQLRELFPKAEEDTLKTVADTYTKYMKELQMDTCWNKAHFFAQAAIETGSKLHIKKGENMDYKSEERLHNVFLSRFFKGKRVKGKFVPLVDSKAEFHDEKNRVFKSKELSQKAKQLINNEQNIANFVYANINGNGNEASGDGWRFRGSGLIQLTGRENFKMVNDKIEKLWGQSILTDSGADQVRENRELAVLTAMGYFAAKGINRIANWASSDQQIKEVCLKVGNDVDIKIKNGKTTNHEEKKRFFKDKSSKTFKTNECTLNSELKIKEGIEWLLSKAITQEDVLKGVHYKVPYANDFNRTHPEGENTMDCSELVCRFLYQIEWCSGGWSGNTFILYDFAEKYSEYLTKHDDISYKPEKGDIFLWRNTNGMGHTGIVIDYDENTDVVTTIESISSKETPEGINKEIVMYGVTQLKWKRLSRHLLSHPNTNGKSTCRFYTPKEHFSKVDKKIIWKGKYVEFKIIIK